MIFNIKKDIVKMIDYQNTNRMISISEIKLFLKNNIYESEKLIFGTFIINEEEISMFDKIQEKFNNDDRSILNDIRTLTLKIEEKD